MESLRRVRYVTGNYEELQGLRRVPYHLALLLTVVLIFSYGRREGVFDFRLVQDGLTFAAFLVAPGLYLRIGRFYERRYGRVRDRRRTGFPLGKILFFVVPVIVLAAVVRGLDPELWESLALQGMAFALGSFVVAVVWFARWWDGGRSRYAVHWLGLAVLVLPATLACLLAFDDLYPAWPLLAIYLGGDTLGGVVDHLILVRTLKTVPKEETDAVG